MTEINTWQDVLEFLSAFTPSELNHPAQIYLSDPDGDKPATLHPVLAIGSADEMFEEEKTRSSIDNKHHGNHLVLLCDHNWFAEDGHVAIDLMTELKIFPENNDG